jgi:DNA-binding HxlR family transcriptional regulator
LADTRYMRNYGQYCPVARGAEIFAERWTPIIMRNVLYGCHTFNDIAAGAPLNPEPQPQLTAASNP